MIILTINDFIKGKYNIPDASGMNTYTKVQEAIDTFEKPYIYQLLGVTLGDLYISWLAASQPVNADYTKILNAFADDNINGINYAYPFGAIVQSLGIKEFLKACVYFEYVKNALVVSQAGVVNTQSETATNSNPDQTLRFAENKYNGILSTVYAIQWYCMNNQTAFPDFNGQSFTIKSAQFFL